MPLSEVATLADVLTAQNADLELSEAAVERAQLKHTISRLYYELARQKLEGEPLPAITSISIENSGTRHFLKSHSGRICEVAQRDVAQVRRAVHASKTAERQSALSGKLADLTNQESGILQIIRSTW